MERLSKQRELIFEIVKGSLDHPTAEDVYTEARKHMPSISLGTVYRNLRQLTTNGRIRSIRFGAEPDRFDGKLQVHEHFICEMCGRVQDIEASLINPSLPGKKITSYKLDYFGECEACLPSNV